MILTCGSEAVTLRNPEFGNTVTTELPFIERQTASGCPIGNKITDWSKKETVHYDIILTKRSDVDAFLTFLEATMGLEISVDGVDGIITTDIAEVITMRDSGIFEINFDLVLT